MFIENLLDDDDLPFVYSLLQGLVAGITAGAITYFLKEKGLRVKIISTVALLTIIISANLLSRS